MKKEDLVDSIRQFGLDGDFNKLDQIALKLFEDIESDDKAIAEETMKLLLELLPDIKDEDN